MGTSESCLATSFLPTGVATLKKQQEMAGVDEVGGRGGIGAFGHCWWVWKIVWLFYKMACWFLRKLNAEAPCDPGISFLGVHPPQLKTSTQSTVHSSRKANHPKCP